jgi:hypothetical protein
MRFPVFHAMLLVFGEEKFLRSLFHDSRCDVPGRGFWNRIDRHRLLGT